MIFISRYHFCVNGMMHLKYYCRHLTKKHSHVKPIYHVKQKHFTFLFCNSFVKTSSITIYFNKFPIIYVLHILYIVRDGKPA